MAFGNSFAAYLTISCNSTLCHCGNLANPGPLGMIADVREVASSLVIIHVIYLSFFLFFFYFSLVVYWYLLDLYEFMWSLAMCFVNLNLK
jgi:hypothetical protein